MNYLMFAGLQAWGMEHISSAAVVGVFHRMAYDTTTLMTEEHLYCGMSKGRLLKEGWCMPPLPSGSAH